jgi:hypothetical protein
MGGLKKMEKETYSEGGRVCLEGGNIVWGD